MSLVPTTDMQVATALIFVSIALKASLLAVVLTAVSWFSHQFFISPLFDPLRRLPGPSASALQNHFTQVMNPSQSPDTHERWTKLFGKTFRFHGFGRHDLRLMSFDFRAVTHVLTSPAFEKPWQTRRLLARLIGRGIFSMEGPEHKLQRKIIGPAFTSLSIRNMTPVFVQKAQELCERWDSILSDELSAPTLDTEVSNQPSEGVIDVAHWLSRASFDVIGLAGFNYHFHALEDESEDIYLAYRRMFRISDKGLRLRGLLDLYIPQLRRVWPTRDTTAIDESLRQIDQFGKKLIAKKKNSLATEQKHPAEIKEKDLLSVLIKSNLSSDPSKRLSDVELLDQCSTFLLAGSDSVSVALSWCLHFLALHPSIQTRLRQEISSGLSSYGLSHISLNGDNSDCSADSGFAEEYIRPLPEGNNSHKAYSAAVERLRFLNNVIRESLRLCPPVHGTIRVATMDDHIPISHPITLPDGTQETQYIKIRKGSYVHIPIEGLNYSSDIWGDDAQVFNPDRWLNLPPTARSPTYPGLGNIMTFGFGPHSCLGYKFTISEMKMFLTTILPRFEFSPVDDVQISKCNSILTRPFITDKWEAGTQLPLRVRKLRSV